ncbi:MAG: hypothetical protein AAGA83_22060 [Cyanobacteria bacterium P01_F01_bin.116]
MVFREFAVLLYYGFVGKLHPPAPEVHQQAQLVADSRLPEWQCFYPDTTEIAKQPQ